jgi:hypothetical protein
MLKNQRKIKGMDKYYKLFQEYNNKSRIRISILKIDNSNRTLFKYYDSKYDKLHFIIINNNITNEFLNYLDSKKISMIYKTLY